MFFSPRNSLVTNDRILNMQILIILLSYESLMITQAPLVAPQRRSASESSWWWFWGIPKAGERASSSLIQPAGLMFGIPGFRPVFLKMWGQDPLVGREPISDGSSFIAMRLLFLIYLSDATMPHDSIWGNITILIFNRLVCI